MDIYLPIAEMSVNAFLLLSIGGGVGFLSGLFGVGGGFLMTPLLIFIGIPPAVAVGSEATQILASSFSGVLAHTRRGNVDVRMGLVLVAGGSVGSILGVFIFAWMRGLGQVDLLVSLCYVVFLGIVGGLMFVESVRAMVIRPNSSAPSRGDDSDDWRQKLPLQMAFPRSQLRTSLLLPLAVGLLVGMLAAMMGVGGGFIMVPAMIYLIGMPTAVVVGTSLFQICFVTALTGYLHAVNNQTVDVVLALLLIAGGVIGAQLGTRVTGLLRGEQLRVLLALLVLLVCGKLAFDLIVTPVDLYSVDPAAAGH
ncbi:MAG: sulfite exporter TauE/SafE family protein [Geminicoccaceae bacterium]